MPRRYSFRYVRVQVLSTSQKYQCIFSNIRVRATSAVSPEIFDAVPILKTKDRLLRRIDLLSRVTLRDCMQTTFEDGPRRDRRLWLGDLRIQALTKYATFRNFNLVKRCLFMFAAVAASDGSLPGCVFELPTLKAASDYIVDYDALFEVAVVEYVEVSSDLETGRILWPTILGSLVTPLAHVDPNPGAFDGSKTSLWKFLDWDESIHRDAGMYGLRLFCLRRVGELGQMLGHPPQFHEVVEKMRSAAISNFFDDRQSVFISGPDRQVSWLSQAWMALAQVFLPKENKRILLAAMHQPLTVRPLCPYGWAVFAEALAKNGTEEECGKLLKSYWGGMVENGADTFWECFDPNDARKSPYGDCRNNFYCHAPSCSPAWLLRYVLV